MRRLRNLTSGTVDDFTEGQAQVRLRNGWVEVEPEPEPPPRAPSRADLDAHARLLGVDPDQYRTKADLAEAIENQE